MKVPNTFVTDIVCFICWDLIGQVEYVSIFKPAQDCKIQLCANVSKSGFILERNMHFVVANIVTPLTQSKGVSFVALWGGRRVDYFVSLANCFC